jgi:hypothetical protein
MHPHFTKEEEYALPPLGLLSALSKGKIEAGMAEVLKMTDKLEVELPRMLAEHKRSWRRSIAWSKPRRRKTSRNMCTLPRS